MIMNLAKRADIVNRLTNAVGNNGFLRVNLFFCIFACSYCFVCHDLSCILSLDIVLSSVNLWSRRYQAWDSLFIVRWHQQGG